MKLRKLTYISIAFIILHMPLFSQKSKVDKADKAFNELSYIKAADLYQIIAESGFKSEKLFKNLADSYYFNANYKEAAKYYEDLFKLNANLEPKYYLRYSQSLRHIGNDKLAKKFYTKFLKSQNGVKKTLTTEDYIARIEKNSGRYIINTVAVNTEGTDFGASKLSEEYVVFSSTSNTRGNNTDPWTQESYLDLFKAKLNKDGSLSDPVSLSGDVNTAYHESSATFTKDGKTLYFTRNNTTPESKKQKTQHLKIYRATLINDKWSNIEDLNINVEGYSTAHPSLSEDNRTLYFVSDKPGGFGMTDIYKVSVDTNGELGVPENLGRVINTAGRESFPFTTKDHQLYFSSDGHFGLGGYDVFYVNLKKSNLSLVNVGKPINSVYDDLAFSIDSKTKKGFFSSNRGDNLDDIYAFTETKELEVFESTISGKVIDTLSREPIANTTISILDLNNTLIKSLKTNSEGNYEVTLPYEKQFLIRAKKETYSTKEDIVTTNKDKVILNFELDKDQKQVTKGTDVAKLLSIENIYFDLDKSYIRQDAEIELTKVVKLLNKYSNLKLEIRSHTDSRANDAYNLALSNRRAKSTLNYIVTNGIASSRLSAKGYGESQLVNNCSNGIRCSEEQHQANRRSEFIIIEN